MDHSPPNDVRLDDAEARMRRALGLDRNSKPIAECLQSGPAPSPVDRFSNRRKFVRDGEVPVEIVQRSQHQTNGDANPLDAARQAIRTQAAAREHAERSLEQAQAQVRQLQTALAHERLAREEATARVEADRKGVEQVLQSVRTELGAEKIAHERSDQALRDAQLTITNLTEKLHIAQQSLTMVKAELAAKRQQARKGRRKPLVASPTDAPAGGGEQPTQPVRKPRGRRATATLVKMVGKPGRAAAKASHPSRMAGKTVTKKVARSKEPKPVKWWLGR